MTSAPASNSKGKSRMLTTLDNTITAINLANELVPLELAKGVLSTVASILSRVNVTIKNQEDFRGLADRCQAISVIISEVIPKNPGSKISPALEEAMVDLKRSLDSIEASIKQKMQSSVGARAFNANVNKDTITGWQQDLDRCLNLFNTKLSIGADIKMDKLDVKIEELKNSINANLDTPSPDALPPLPPIFFGRDALVRRTVELLLQHKHAVLIGPGGIGKTCIARAVLNDSEISTKFGASRYFVRYDDIDASQITHATFLDRILRALGISSSSVDPHSVIAKALALHEVLLVLDNAETFLDAARERGSIANSIDEFGALDKVSIMITTRTAVLPTNLVYTRLNVPVLDEGPAFQVFKEIYRPEIEPAILSQLLSALDFHPLSINLLAQAAFQNDWTPDELTKAWEDQHAGLLHNGDGKVQSLAVSIELSLNSPSLKKLGKTVQDLSQIIAFLPQGVNNTILGDLFPTVANVRGVVDMLCKHSLAYRKADFITMLAPVRMYLSPKNPSLSTVPMLVDVQKYYQEQLACRPVDRDWIKIEDVNVEHLVTLGLSQCNAGNTKEACTICKFFIDALKQFKPRPTALGPVILALQCHSPGHIMLSIPFLPGQRQKKDNLHAKGKCLQSLATLVASTGQITECLELKLEVYKIFLALGNAAREDLIY
ncbi:hypothetical protein H0H81_001494, partial [Sphagnurus paluster]